MCMRECQSQAAIFFRAADAVHGALTNKFYIDISVDQVPHGNVLCGEWEIA